MNLSLSSSSYIFFHGFGPESLRKHVFHFKKRKENCWNKKREKKNEHKHCTVCLFFPLLYNISTYKQTHTHNIRPEYYQEKKRGKKIRFGHVGGIKYSENPKSKPKNFDNNHTHTHIYSQCFLFCFVLKKKNDSF